MVRADEKRVRQIFINLLGNAIKFTAQGQVTFKLRYAREMAHIDIEDTGPGMSQAELGAIFEPFSRGSSDAPGQASGAGLGLTIAKMLTDLMGGEMTVVSTPGQGSVFRVRLFLPEVHGAHDRYGKGKPQAQLPKRQPRGYAGPRRKLLVVDNEELERELMVQLLQPMGFELRLAASGHDCLDLLAAGYRPDAIFMDLAMPGIDGCETIRRLRVDGHTDIALAIVSANAFDKGLHNDLGVRAEDFIVKPYRHTDLFDWLERRLGVSWLYELPAPAADLPAVPPTLPDEQQRAALLEVVNLGFYRGIMNQLDEIEKLEPQACKFVEGMRVLARQFQFEAMAQQLKSDQDANA